MLNEENGQLVTEVYDEALFGEKNVVVMRKLRLAFVWFFLRFKLYFITQTKTERNRNGCG